MMYKETTLYRAIFLAGAFRYTSAACPQVGGTFTVTGVCDVLSVKAVCPDVSDDAARRGCQDASVKFEDVAGNHYQYDKEYMDGGTILNDIQQTLPVDAGRVTATDENVADDNVIAWPEYEAREFYEEENYGEVQGYGAHMTNFDLDESCDLRTVMCCFVDNANGVFDDNTDVCYQDLEMAKRSNHVSHGYSNMGGDDPTHCVGFSWEDGGESDALKGNSLFHISYKNRIENGYAKNVPGAPMCACIEKMPTVEKAACVEVSGSSTFTFTYESADKISGTNTAEVAYSDCGDLQTHFAKKASTEEINEMNKYLVGDGGCGEAAESFLNDKNFIPSTRSYYSVDTNEWAQWVGHGMLWYPYDVTDANYEASLAKIDALLRSLLADSPEQIVYRHCPSCLDTHKHIYYKRLTDWPTYNIAKMFMDSWRNVENMMGEDFYLYSSYEDALNGTNEWKYCTYNAGYGFPHDCGPERWTGCQWNRYRHGNCHEPSPNTHGYYVKKA